MFDAKTVKEEIVQWIRAYFAESGPDCIAVVGISGGKDSSVTAALCKQALGAQRVLGILMPCGVQKDIDAAYRLVNHLAIPYHTINIQSALDGVKACTASAFSLSGESLVSLPARLRMVTLYAAAQSVNGRVANTCNLSEDWVGYFTRWGDGAGDFCPIGGLTVTEVRQLGRELGLPRELIEKTPTDGLCGLTDEDNLGFTYAVLDRYIRTGVCEDAAVKARIDKMHEACQYKLRMSPAYSPSFKEPAVL